MKPLSPNGYITLRYISGHYIPLHTVVAFKMNTIYSLLERGYIEFNRKCVYMTWEGQAALNMYGRGNIGIIWRKKQTELSKNVAYYMRRAA